MFGISKNVKYIAVAPGASKLPALKKVRPCRGLNPGCPCSLVNIENEEEFGVYSEQKTDPLLEKSFRNDFSFQGNVFLELCVAPELS